MLKRNMKKQVTIVFIVVFVFFTILALSATYVYADGGSISAVNTYPKDGETYGFIDHFLYQTMAVNANTTLSVSIDHGPLRAMTYQGIRNEVNPIDGVAHDWFTWQLTTPAVTTPGNHTVQFFSHYYVWQETDQYWAEFNAYSNVQSFTVTQPLSSSSQSPPPTTNLVYVLAAFTATQVVAVSLVIVLVPRRRRQ